MSPSQSRGCRTAVTVMVTMTVPGQSLTATVTRDSDRDS
jgi:hypothetical protein